MATASRSTPEHTVASWAVLASNRLSDRLSSLRVAGQPDNDPGLKPRFTPRGSQVYGIFFLSIVHLGSLHRPHSAPVNIFAAV